MRISLYVLVDVNTRAHTNTSVLSAIPGIKSDAYMIIVMYLFDKRNNIDFEVSVIKFFRLKVRINQIGFFLLRKYA